MSTQTNPYLAAAEEIFSDAGRLLRPRGSARTFLDESMSALRAGGSREDLRDLAAVAMRGVARRVHSDLTSSREVDSWPSREDDPARAAELWASGMVVASDFIARTHAKLAGASADYLYTLDDALSVAPVPDDDRAAGGLAGVRRRARRGGDELE